MAQSVDPPTVVPRTKGTWLVSLTIPVEAASAADASREFWSYVGELGSGELPVFVAPAQDELSMQAYVQGEEVNLDPEGDD